MTEQSWQRGGKWQQMLAAIEGKTTARKQMLYLCAGLRSIWHLLYDERSRRAVGVTERYLDGLATSEELDRAAYFAEAPTFGFAFDASFVQSHRTN